MQFDVLTDLRTMEQLVLVAQQCGFGNPAEGAPRIFDREGGKRTVDTVLSMPPSAWLGKTGALLPGTTL